MTTEPLADLRDIEGVFGSFVIDAGGAPTRADVPAYVDATALRESGARVARLRDALSSSGAAFSYADLDFGAQQLFIQAVGADTLCVLSELGTSRPALRMGAKLVARRLESAPAAQRPMAAEAPSAPAGTARPAASAATPAKRPRFFRGRRID